MKIGFIGLGMMGAGMASNLQKAGHELVVNDLTRQAASKHLNAGATWADSPRAVAEACDIVFTSLPTPADVQDVGTGENGLDRGFPAWLRLVRPFNQRRRRRARPCTRTSPRKGVRFPRCTGQRRSKGANSGRLAIWVGGDKAVFDKYHAVLAAMGDQARLYRPDRCRIDRQTGAQCLLRRGERRAVRGLHHGDQSRRRTAGACSRRCVRVPPAATACSIGWRTISSPAATIPPTSPCACCTRTSRSPANWRARCRCRCG